MSGKPDAGRLYADGVMARDAAAAASRAMTATRAENPLPPELDGRIITGDSRDLSRLPDGCVHLAVTSPPYNCGKEYDEDLSLAEFRELLRDVMAAVKRTLAPGGRVCVNVANLGRAPYIPVNAYLAADMLDLGYLMRGEIIWQKGHRLARRSSAWGSWMSPSNPTLRDTHEYIQVYSSGSWQRRPAPGGPKPTIAREEFQEFTRGVWEFPPESARRAGHPAPFPVELPRRCLQLYTWPGDTLLDPFAGSGSTGEAAIAAGRKFVGWEKDPDYAEAARLRLRNVAMRDRPLPLPPGS